MSDKDLSSAIRSIIEKEINKVSKLVPKEALNNIEKNISPQIDQIIEKSGFVKKSNCLLYTSPSPRDRQKSRMPSSA